jgi:hypothetical protein
MKGSQTVRHCTECKKDVYNLSAMTDREASALLASGEQRCMRVEFRPDGAIVSTRRLTRKRAAAATLAASLATFSFVAATVPDAPEASRADGTRVAMGGMRLHLHIDPYRRARHIELPPEEPMPAITTDVPTPEAPRPMRGVLGVLGALFGWLAAWRIASRRTPEQRSP